jgi:hypothetical protein
MPYVEYLVHRLSLGIIPLRVFQLTDTSRLWAGAGFPADPSTARAQVMAEEAAKGTIGRYLDDLTARALTLAGSFSGVPLCLTESRKWPRNIPTT